MIKNKLHVAILVFLVVFLMGFPFQLSAKVTGLCSNCHTMHNSQDGSSVFRGGPGVAWNGSGQLTGTKSTTPYKRLLVTSCVGCHSSSTGSTILNIGGSTIPIVFNTSGYPAQPLAGGNFYYVSLGGAANDVYGHNVYGISNPDNNLTNGAPGNENCGGLTTPCHKTLAVAPSSENYDRGGCEGCHYNVFHHTDNGIYRFLSTGHEAGGSASYYVDGDEDSDWEQTTTTHNWYKGFNGPVNGGTLATTHSISTYCGGCHKDFHRRDYIGGTSSPWVRHPTDIALPTTGEYSGYNPVTNYSVEAPVAWTNPKGTTDKGTPIVMCLSCHRPHGTDQPDMLRWDYDDMVVETTGTAADTGCFTCHTTKDGT